MYVCLLGPTNKIILLLNIGLLNAFKELEIKKRVKLSLANAKSLYIRYNF